MRNVAVFETQKTGLFGAKKIKGIYSWPVFKIHEGTVLFNKMMTRMIVVLKPRSTFVHFPYCMYKGLACMRHMKKKMGDDTGDLKVDNIVMPATGHPSLLCFVYQTAGMEPGTVLPLNENANKLIVDIFGSQRYVFHGPVVVCYIKQDGSRLCKDISNPHDLDAAIADVRKAILAGGEVTRAECFRDAAETDAPALEAVEATVPTEATAPAEAAAPAEPAVPAEPAALEQPAAKRAHH